jgi:hypothetical protein
MDRERLAIGALVAYYDLRQFPVGTVRQGIATGMEIVDPGTEEQWVPVRRSDRVVDLVPAALIVDVLRGPGR